MQNEKLVSVLFAYLQETHNIPPRKTPPVSYLVFARRLHKVQLGNIVDLWENPINKPGITEAEAWQMIQVLYSTYEEHVRTTKVNITDIQQVSDIIVESARIKTGWSMDTEQYVQDAYRRMCDDIAMQIEQMEAALARTKTNMRIGTDN